MKSPTVRAPEPQMLFVGRTQELEQLRAALTQASAGTGRVAMLAGEPGIGKTRTAVELATAASSSGALVLRGSCYEGEWGHAYGPFVEALTAYVRAVDSAQLALDLGVGAAPLARLVPALRERLPDVGEPVSLQPDEERFRLFDAVSQLLIAVAQRAPLVLLLDDLHWADRGTLALLRHVAHFVPEHPILLVGAYRDVEVDVAHPLAELLGALRRESSYERIILKGLGDGETAELITALAGKTIALPIVTGITAHAEGNPFFVHEMVQHLREDDALGDEELREFPDLALPDGIRHLIGRRIQRLSATTNRVLTVGSAFTGPFHFGIASAVAGVEHDAALSAIDEALNARLIQATGHADRYDFTHALIRHALYLELNPSRRARMHRQLAQEMERQLEPRARDHAGEIAGQYHRSRDLPGGEGGVAFALSAADRAEAVSAHSDVAALVQMALDLLPPSDARRPRLSGRCAIALAWSLDFDRAPQMANLAADLIASAEGGAAAADYLAEAVTALNEAGGAGAAFAIAPKGLALAGERRDWTWATLMASDLLRRDSEDPNHPGIVTDTPARREVTAVFARTPTNAGFRTQISDELSLTLFNSGQYREGLTVWYAGARDGEKNGHLASAIGCWACAMRFHTALGEFASAAAAYRQAVVLAKRVTLPASVHTAVMTAAEDERRMALDMDWDQPMEHVGPALGDGTMLILYLAGTQASIARIHARMGRTAKALRRVDSTIAAIVQAPAWAENYVRICCDAAETLWLTASATHADLIARNVLDKILPADLHYPMCDARLALARLSALEGRYDAACDWFAKARLVLDQQGARPLRAITDYDEALMFARRDADGDRSRAELLLEQASAQFRALGMPGWIRRAEHLLEHGREWTRAERDQGSEGSRERATEGERAGVERRSDTRHPKPDTHLFRRSGDMWVITFSGTTVQLRHARGLQYLACLLAQPTRELHATEVIGAPADVTTSSRPAEETQVIAADLGDAGSVLDAEATSQYQRRLSELREELAEAEANHDLGRTAGLREELAFLAEQLASAGRGRRSASHAERARVTVAKGIAAAMKKIAAAHPALGRHLKATIRTGYFCSYTPDPRVEWEV